MTKRDWDKAASRSRMSRHGVSNDEAAIAELSRPPMKRREATVPLRVTCRCGREAVLNVTKEQYRSTTFRSKLRCSKCGGVGMS